MVKLFIRNERLYLERAGKDTELESATIHHHKVQGKYQIIVFPDVVKTIKRGQIFIQKTYPLVGIKLEKSKYNYSEERPYYVGKGKTYYINYYVV